MKLVAEEANAARSRGFVLVGFQVVESEAMVVSLYHVTTPVPTSPLVGE